MNIGKEQKQSTEVLDYDVDHKDWLPPDDTIVGYSVAADTGVTVSCTLSGAIVKVWVSGGTIGKTYKVKVTITTAAGRVKQSEFTVQIKDY